MGSEMCIRDSHWTIHCKWHLRCPGHQYCIDNLRPTIFITRIHRSKTGFQSLLRLFPIFELLPTREGEDKQQVAIPLACENSFAADVENSTSLFRSSSITGLHSPRAINFHHLLAVSRFLSNLRHYLLCHCGPKRAPCYSKSCVLPLKNIFLACLFFSRDMSQLDDRHILSNNLPN